MENVYNHEGYTVREINGNIASVAKDETIIYQAGSVESKGAKFVPKGTMGIVIGLRKPMQMPHGDEFVWVMFHSINRTAFMKFSDLVVHM